MEYHHVEKEDSTQQEAAVVWSYGLYDCGFRAKTLKSLNPKGCGGFGGCGAGWKPKTKEAQGEASKLLRLARSRGSG